MFTTKMTLSLSSWSCREERAVIKRPRHCHRQLPKERRLGSHSNSIVVVYFLKFEQFKRLLSSTRLSYLKIPVETFTAPYAGLYPAKCRSQRSKVFLFKYIKYILLIIQPHKELCKALLCCRPLQEVSMFRPQQVNRRMSHLHSFHRTVQN